MEHTRRKLEENGEELLGILCECYKVPENTTFRLGGQYYCEYVVDGIRVYLTDKDETIFDNLTFLHYFKIKDSLIPEVANSDKENDKCTHCIRFRNFPEEVCTECKQKSVSFHLEGACLIGSCSCCGLTFVGASFFAACESDNDEYHILLRNSNIEKRTLVKLAKILNYNVLEFVREVNAGKVLSLGYSLRQIMKLLSFLEDNAIAYEIVPPLPYSKIRYCTYWNS